MRVLNWPRRAIRQLLASVGIGAYPLWGPRFGLNVFRDLKKYAPEHPFEVVLDVGANVGEFALSASRAFCDARVYAFEPVAGTFDQLQKATKGQSRITCVKCALGETKEERRIRLLSACQLNSLLNEADPAAPDADGGHRVETVKVIRLDSFAAERSLDRIDLLKIDTEGFELEVMRGAGDMLGRTAFILCEVGFDVAGGMHVPFRAIAELLWDEGFTMVAAYDTFYYFNEHPDGYGDVLFVRHGVCRL